MAPPHLPENVYLFGPALPPAMLLLPTFNARLLPCPESWAAMTPAAQGRHCVRCQRVVQDFSQSTNPAADLAAARAAAPDGRVCGRFAGAQVQGPQPLLRRLRWFLVALVLAQGLGAREALAQVQGVQHKTSHKTKFVKPAKSVELLGDVEALPSRKALYEPTEEDLKELKSKKSPTIRKSNLPYDAVPEQMPLFRGGGIPAILNYIKHNAHYPNDAPHGQVWVEFLIDSVGQMQNPTIVKGLTPGADAEVIRVIKTMNGFTPGMYGGHPINIGYTLPVTFKKL